MAARESATCPNCGSLTAIRNNMHREQWLCSNCMTRFVYTVPVPEPVAQASATPAQSAEPSEAEEPAESGERPLHVVVAESPKERRSRKRAPKAEPVTAEPAPAEPVEA